jgi:hypothetical protein
MAGWGLLALLLLLPLVAMQFTDEVNWDAADFLVMGVLLASVGLAFELAARMSGDAAYRAAAGLAIVAAFLLIWVNLAVGIIGAEDNPANLMYAGVLAVGGIGALVARLRPAGMARAMFATAAAVALVALIALVAGLDTRVQVVFANLFFVALFAASAWQFREAARHQEGRGRA